VWIVYTHRHTMGNIYEERDSASQGPMLTLVSGKGGALLLP
jgi:hypothetical protein